MSFIVQQGSATPSTTATDTPLGELLHLFERSCGQIKPDPILAQQWAQARYAAVLERYDWPFLEKEGLIATVDDITSDSVTVTVGSTTVTETTSDGKWTSAINGRKFRRSGRDEYYVISGYSNANPDTFTLDRNYEGATATAANYRIFQNVYSLPADCGRVLAIRRINEQYELLRVSRADLDAAYPNRPTIGNPQVWAPAGRDSNNIQQVELYPIPDSARGLVVRYLEETPALSGAATNVVTQVSYPLLMEGMLADYWLWRANRMGASGNELTMASAFEQKFEKKVQEMFLREIPNWPQKRIRLESRFVNKNFERARKHLPDHSSQFPDE